MHTEGQFVMMETFWTEWSRSHNANLLNASELDILIG
jgi:hypothetical protein